MSLALVVVVAFAAVLAALGWALLHVLRAGRNNSEATALIAAGGAFAGILVSRNLGARSAEMTARRDRLGRLYEELVGRFIDSDAAGGTETGWSEWNTKLLVWGDPAVIRAWTAFQRAHREAEPLRDRTLMFEKFINAMRDDIGVSNKALEEGDLMRIYVNDWDTVDWESLDDPAHE